MNAALSCPKSGASLADWLSYLESIHHRPIDMGLERVRTVADRLGLLPLNAVVITVGGTNGKGSTCAMLESMLLQAGYRTALYTSPHLIDFNERARLQGESASDAALIDQFEAVEQARGEVSLTYFEFTTLAILRLFKEAAPDVVILEVGLGGRLDAVNIVDADCSIITSVDLDHQEYLGPTRESIGFEKAHTYRAGRPAICGDPVPPESLVRYAESIGADLWRFGHDFNYSGDKQQWSYGGRSQRRNALAYPALRGANQLLNASAALAALEALRDRIPVPAQSVRQGLILVELPGRFQVLPGRPTVVLDVAHNPHAMGVLAANLDNMGFHPFTHAVVGMMADKDMAGVLTHLKDRVDHWYVCDLPTPRAAKAAQLAQLLQELGVTPGEERSIQQFSSAQSAWQAASSAAGENDRIVVCGSFVTVSEVVQARRSRPAPAADRTGATPS